MACMQDADMNTENNTTGKMSFPVSLPDTSQQNVQMESLKWMNHIDTIVDFQKFLQGDLQTCDITLAFKGRSVKAHRFVLSICSSLLRKLLRDVPIGEEATIIVPETEGSLLNSVLNFIYTGETDISSTRLTEFLDAVGNLGIKTPINFDYAENNEAKKEIINVTTGIEEELQVSTIVDHDMSQPYFEIKSYCSLAPPQIENSNRTDDVPAEHIHMDNPMTENQADARLPCIQIDSSDDDFTEHITEPRTLRNTVDRLRAKEKTSLNVAVLAHVKGGISLKKAAMVHNVSRTDLLRQLKDHRRSISVKMSSIARFGELNQKAKATIIRKRIRQNSDPFDLPDSKFIEYFRLSKEAFRYVLDEVIEKNSATRTVSAVPPILKLAATLRILAEGTFRPIADGGLSLGLAQPTICVIFNQFINVLEAKICPKWIQFNMTKEDILQAKCYFYEKTGFPSVIGCVDGTHIRVATPKKDVKLFVDNKGFCCLKAMLVCDHKMYIRYIDATYPGNAKDAHIWNRSQLRTKLKDNFESGDKNNWLLGDAAYPLEPYLMTPYRDAQEGSPESIFNEIHARARDISHRTIVLFKKRFHCLHSSRQLKYESHKATIITNVCAALHNICNHYNVPFTSDGSNIDENDLLDTGEEDDCEHRATEVALDIRKQIMNSMC